MCIRDRHLIKQMDFKYSDGSAGSVFIVSGVDDYVPEIKSMILEMLLTGILILLMAGILLTAWVYKSILKPLGMLQKATNEIKNGNLDFSLEVEEEDEIGQICQDFEEMRIRLKESTEEKLSLIHILLPVYDLCEDFVSADETGSVLRDYFPVFVEME